MAAPAVDVETDLTASMVAMWTLVRTRLTAERPKLGVIRQQATAAFERERPAWRGLAADACRGLAGDPKTGGLYADQLGGVLSRAAAQGLAMGMDVLVGKGWDPEVAWQRVLSGYGLDARGMRGLLGGTMQAPNAGGAGVASSAAAHTAVRALLVWATKLARTEANAWSKARDHVAKAYNPRQPRNEDGEWALSNARRPKAKVKVKEAQPALFLPPVAPEAPVVDPNRFVDPSRFVDPARFVDPDRFTASDPNRFATADAGRFADPTKFTRKQQQVNRNFNRTMIIRLGGIKDPEGAPPDEVGDPRGELHLPMQDIANYVHFPWAGKKTANLSSLKKTRNGTYIDFTSMRVDHELRGLPWDPVEVRYGHDPARSADPDLPELEFGVWEDLAEMAKPIWNEAYHNPALYASKLDEGDLDVIWHDAGMAGSPTRLDVLAKIDELQDTLDMDHEPKDPSLRNALADHVAWRRPDVVGENGKAFDTELHTYFSDTDIYDHVPPGVLVFPKGLAEGDDAADITGLYKVHHVEYVSALGSGGTGAREGIIGVQKIYLEPKSTGWRRNEDPTGPPYHPEDH